MKYGTALLFAWMLATTVASGLEQNLVTNGSFENFSGATGHAPNVNRFWKNVPGWNEDALDGSPLEIRPGDVWAPNTGSWSCTLNGFDSDVVEQTIVTTPGEAYELSFAWKPRATLAVLSQGIVVDFDGQEVFSDVALTPASDVAYTTVTLTVYATGNASVLSFSNPLNTGSVGTVIDTVSVLPLGLVITGEILELADVVSDLNLQNGIENSLDVKLQSAVDALEDLNIHNDPQAADGKMQAFENAVEAQIGNGRISAIDGSGLLVRAARVRGKLAEMQGA